jgi:hypothetical protein
VACTPVAVRTNRLHARLAEAGGVSERLVEADQLAGIKGPGLVGYVERDQLSGWEASPAAATVGQPRGEPIAYRWTVPLDHHIRAALPSGAAFAAIGDDVPSWTHGHERPMVGSADEPGRGRCDQAWNVDAEELQRSDSLRPASEDPKVRVGVLPPSRRSRPGWLLRAHPERGKADPAPPIKRVEFEGIRYPGHQLVRFEWPMQERNIAPILAQERHHAWRLACTNGRCVGIGL